MDEKQKDYLRHNYSFLKSYSSFLALELIQMSRYFHRMDSLLQENQIQFAHEELEIENTMLTEALDLLEPMSTYYGETYFLYPYLLFSSFIITCYSLIERDLVKICQALKITISISIKDKGISDKGIDRAAFFLKKGIGYEIEQNDWRVLKTIQAIRNRLVHGDENITFDLLSKDKKVYQYLRQYDLCESEEAPIKFNSQYCQHLIEFSLMFFGKIFKDFGFENSDCFKLDLLPWYQNKNEISLFESEAGKDVSH